MSEQEKNIMMVRNNCIACDNAKEILKDKIVQGKLIPMDVDTPEGKALADKHNVESIPTIINKKGIFEQKCYLSKDGSKMYCDDGTEKVI